MMNRRWSLILLALHKRVKDKTPFAFPLRPHACNVIRARRVLPVVSGLRGRFVRNDCHIATGECELHIRKGVLTHITFWHLGKLGIDIFEALCVEPDELRRQIFSKCLHLFVLERFRDDFFHIDDSRLPFSRLRLPGWSRCSKTNRESCRHCQDRKSVVKGKREDLGGGRIIKKKKRK